MWVDESSCTHARTVGQLMPGVAAGGNALAVQPASVIVALAKTKAVHGRQRSTIGALSATYSTELEPTRNAPLRTEGRITPGTDRPGISRTRRFSLGRDPRVSRGPAEGQGARAPLCDSQACIGAWPWYSGLDSVLEAVERFTAAGFQVIRARRWIAEGWRECVLLGQV